MVRKGKLSNDEKKEILFDLIRKSNDFFQLKEIESLIKKDKRINPFLTKDLLNELIDTNLIRCEKIGTSNYYWATNVKKQLENQVIYENVVNENLKSELETLEDEIRERKQLIKNIDKKSLKKQEQEMKKVEERLKELEGKMEELERFQKEEMNRYQLKELEENIDIFDEVFWEMKNFLQKHFHFDESGCNELFKIHEEDDMD
ncbi:hypothetical protein SNEBB_002146 [Seison nebaliae]|nr:hypothetical protein SNEBB_002146 [Seison nebaliae]